MMQEKIETAVILVGGEGLRLKPITNDRPKPMVEILGKPLLLYTLEWLKKYGIKRIVFGVAYKKEIVMDFFGDGSKFGIKIDYSNHTVEGGTAEGFHLAIERFVDDENFLAMNGDELTNLNLNKLAEFHLKNNSFATVVMSPLKSPFGVINVDKDDFIISFIEKPIFDNLLVSTGIYMFNKKILDHIPEKGSIERSTFSILANNKKLKGYRIDGDWITINNIKDLQNAESILSGWFK